MQAGKASPFSIAKTHVVYLRYGKHIGSQANQEMQGMLAAAAITTPSVAASGATTVWANGPAAPPKSKQPLNGLRPNALNGSIGSLEMAALHIGALADKIN